jgi:hypothetical protein
VFTSYRRIYFIYLIEDQSYPVICLFSYLIDYIRFLFRRQFFFRNIIEPNGSLGVLIKLKLFQIFKDIIMHVYGSHRNVPIIISNDELSYPTVYFFPNLIRPTATFATKRLKRSKITSPIPNERSNLHQK